ncbi:hypothetical protein B0T16DRAFT_3387 [Cercophora newfieldiana]|uniref:Uncharacterized protein n=1 Tax=Cercophora newfieldiana TaxID=92897 RepID=A0AA40CZQ6_9PEZI|nr:hypothetical protein B0T16DRAFT_3387 [Cercophora newfieldiana]
MGCSCQVETWRGICRRSRCPLQCVVATPACRPAELDRERRRRCRNGYGAASPITLNIKKYGLDPICKELDVNTDRRRAGKVMLKKGLRTPDPGTTSYSEPAKGTARGGKDVQAMTRASERRLVGASWSSRGEPIRLERAALNMCFIYPHFNRKFAGCDHGG